MALPSFLGNMFGGDKSNENEAVRIPAPVGRDPRLHIDNPAIEKPRFSNLPNTVANILIKDSVDTSDLKRGAKEFINHHGFKTKQSFEFDVEPEKLTEETMRTIVTGILAYYIPEIKAFDDKALRSELHLTPGRAVDLLLVTLFVLSENRPMFKEFMNSLKKELPEALSGLFETNSAL
jgi:hypothetical protein